MSMKYKSISDPTDFNFSMKMASRPPMPSVSVEAKNLIANAGYDGKISDDYVQLLPKFALQYEWKKGNNVYATVSKGYRSGGYNVQMFSDLISGDLQNSMINAIKESEQFARFAAMIDKYAKKADVPEVKEATRYKPEYSWNYEVGSHLTLGRVSFGQIFPLSIWICATNKFPNSPEAAWDVPPSMQGKAAAMVPKCLFVQV